MEEKRELIKSYNDLTVEDKRRELEMEILEVSLIMQELLTDLNPDYPNIRNITLSGKSSMNTSESEYLTILYENIINLKEDLGEYCDFATSLYYDDKDEYDFDN